MSFDPIKIREEFLKADTPEKKTELLKKYKENSHFCWLLSKTYGVTANYNTQQTQQIDPELVQKTESVKGLKLQDGNSIKVKEVVDFLSADRNLFGGKSGLVIERCKILDFKYKDILFEILNGNLFNLDANIINQAFGFQFIPEIRCFGTTDFREDFYKSEDKWKYFEKKAGSLATILVYGDCVEIFSKQGKTYRIFDSLRKEFQRIPVDGLFQCQLFYEENGVPDQKKFFSETAKKEQSEDFKCEVFDYTTLSSLSGTSNGKTYEERYGMAKMLISNYISDKRISTATLNDFNLENKQTPNCDSYVVCCGKPFGKMRPKHFMTWKKK